jgi:hypothetical protein
VIKDALDEISETTPEKEQRLAAMCDAEAAGKMPQGATALERWIGARPAAKT